MANHNNDLIRLRMALNTTRLLPDDVAKWLSNGLDDFESGYAKNLCDALGIKNPWKTKTRSMIRHRDRLLKLAVDTCYSPHDASIWPACKRLSAMIKHYKQFPRTKPDNPLIEQIFAIGIHVPSTPEQIYKRITGTS